MNLSDAIGFAGVTILLIAFLLNLLQVLDYNNRIYISLNIIGAGLACLASVMINYKPFIILEGTWTVVSMVALLNSFRRKRDA